MSYADESERLEKVRETFDFLDNENRPSDEEVDWLVQIGLLPDYIIERNHPADEARGYIRGYREAVDAVDGSRYPNRPLLAELLRVEHDLTERISSIDHSGRGSGCCQAESGLKSQRRAVRWMLFGEWIFPTRTE